MQQQHSHDHDHGDHEHPAAPMVEEITDFEVLEIAVRELAIEKGLFTAEDHRKFTEWAESIGPAAGSRLVAKAWTDPAFKARVLADAVAACREIGIDWTEPTGSGTPSDYMELRVLEDTPTLHHVIVCTLCSCYPRPLLGHSPYWYRSPNYRRRLVRRPRHVLEEFGLIIPPEVEVRVEDSEPEMPVYGPSRAARRHRELDGGAVGGDRDPRLHDRRCLAPARQEDRRRPTGPYGSPAGRSRGPASGGRPMSGKSGQPPAAGEHPLEPAPIPLLEALRNDDKTWEQLAPRYGVTNPDPPWKVSLYATCECLAAGAALPALERRRAEDQLGETVYGGIPAPEQQLLALAHIMLSRGLLSEQDLAGRIDAVRSRLEAC